MPNYTTLDNLSKSIENELKSYSENTTEKVKKAVDDVMSDLVKNTKRDAKEGRRKGKYKKSISSKVIIDNKYEKKKIWFVKPPEYRLAHLLNNGHRTKKNGFIKGDKHITKNEEIAIKDFEKRVEESIKDVT